jgi:hypothetical protein
MRRFRLGVWSKLHTSEKLPLLAGSLLARDRAKVLPLLRRPAFCTTVVRSTVETRAVSDQARCMFDDVARTTVVNHLLTR